MNKKQGSDGTVSSTEHVPVLLQEVLENLNIEDGGIYFDGTFGGGGYSKAIATVAKNIKVIATDLDSGAIKRGLKNVDNLDVSVEKTNFSNISDVAKKYGVSLFNGIVVDLGFSSDQVGEAGMGRGFSFKNLDDPLLMTLNDNPSDDETTAFDIVNYWQEENMADVIYGFGGEHYSRRIAKAIVEKRMSKEIATVGELIDVIKSATPTSYHHGKTHPATKTFQALRIAVNAEYQNLNKFLDNSLELLAPGAQIVVVAFHGGENKIVRKKFQDWERKGEGERISKKAIKPSREEIVNNPRARSALMRVFKKK